MRQHVTSVGFPDPYNQLVCFFACLLLFLFFYLFLFFFLFLFQSNPPYRAGNHRFHFLDGSIRMLWALISSARVWPLSDRLWTCAHCVFVCFNSLCVCVILPISHRCLPVGQRERRPRPAAVHNGRRGDPMRQTGWIFLGMDMRVFDF